MHIKHFNSTNFKFSSSHFLLRYLSSVCRLGLRLKMLCLAVVCIIFGHHSNCFAQNDFGSEELPLYFWRQPNLMNFGDHLSLKLVERIVNSRVRVYQKNAPERKLLAIGSILYFASENDVIWGSGVNGKRLLRKDYNFSSLDVRAVRGPLTRQYLIDHFQISCPEIYGDPALLMPYFFPEFKPSESPTYDYLIIPHYSEIALFPKSEYPNVVYPTEPWDVVVGKIMDSKFVISSSLHGVVVAEAYGIPARLLKISDHEPLFKYQDYYWGTNRQNFEIAFSVEEALMLGGEVPFECDLEKLYNAFPFEFWTESNFTKPNFSIDILNGLTIHQSY